MDKMRSIWIVRHGERIDKVDPTWVNIAPRGAWDDPVLTEYGHKQAREVGLYFSKLDESIDHVFCSPFTRTLQTATGILDTMQSTKPNLPPIFVELGFAESLTLCQPKPGHLEIKELKEIFPRIDVTYKPFHTEHYVETTNLCCQRRVTETLRKILKAYTGNILIVSHGAPISACHNALLGRHIKVGLCSISKYTVHEKPLNKADTCENENVIKEVAHEFMIISDNYYFKPDLIGDSSHLSDRSNSRDK